MSVGAVELGLAATQVALRWMEYSARAQAGEMTEEERQEVWDEIEQTKKDVQARLKAKLAAKRGEQA